MLNLYLSNTKISIKTNLNHNKCNIHDCIKSDLAKELRNVFLTKTASLSKTVNS